MFTFLLDRLAAGRGSPFEDGRDGGDDASVVSHAPVGPGPAHDVVAARGAALPQVVVLRDEAAGEAREDVVRSRVGDDLGCAWK